MPQKTEHLFGTDGIRGVANQHPMTSEIALSVGRALAFLFQNGRRHRKILIGKDTRLSGYMLETAVASGIASMGTDVLLVGPMPTSGVAFLTQGMRADAGIMISASHNSFRDNGIKVFDRNGFKLPDEKEKEIEELIFSDRLDRHRAVPERIGKAYRVEEAKGRYIEFLKGSFPRELTLEGMRVVVDCAHGAAYEVAPTVLEELGADVISLGTEPNGLNINDQCGAVFPEKTAQKVLATGAHLGVALDGDADRAVFVDEKGRRIDGDAILAVCGEHWIRKKLLPENTVVATVMSNLGLEDYLCRVGGRLVRTVVGDRYVCEAMREKGYLLGGESSGHLIFGRYATTGDGILAALQVLAILKERALSLSELVGGYQAYPQVLKNVRVKKWVDLKTVPLLGKKIEEVEKELAHQGRALVRYSGTEPVIRVMVEGLDPKKIEHLAEEIAVCASELLA